MLCGVVVRVGVLRDVQVALDDASRVREGRPLAPTEARNSPARRRLTGAYAVGPEAGDWLQQAALAIRASVSLDLLADTIQPSPRSTSRGKGPDGRRRLEATARRGVLVAVAGRAPYAFVRSPAR